MVHTAGKRNRTFVIIIFSAFLLLCFVFLILYSLYLTRTKRGEQNEEKESFDYMFLNYNKNLSSTTSGITSIYRELEEDEYISYNNNQNGNFHLISNFGTNQYLCEGSCFCNVNEYDELKKRRSSSNIVLTRGLVYLVAAVSSFVAIEQAKVWYTDECRNVFEPGKIIDIPCPPDNIKSEVDQCDKFQDIAPIDSERRKYWCKGKCIRKVFGIEKIEIMSQQFDCERLIRKGEVEVTHLKSKEDVMGIARRTFQNIFLDPYCEKESKVTAFFNSPHEEEPDTILYHTVGLCGGKTPEHPENPSVICVQTYPETKTALMIEEEMASLSERYREEDEDIQRQQKHQQEQNTMIGSYSTSSSSKNEEEEEELFYQELEEEYYSEMKYLESTKSYSSPKSHQMLTIDEEEEEEQEEEVVEINDKKYLGD